MRREIKSQYKILLIFTFLVISNTGAKAQSICPEWQWAISAGGNSGDNGQSITVDKSGNTYITGHFSGTANFGTTSLADTGNSDIFVAKLNNSGQWAWAVRAGGKLHDQISGITVDAAGNTYITGKFYGSANFGSISLTSVSGSYEMFVAKLNSNGQWQWAICLTSYNSVQTNDIISDANGNLYLTGSFGGKATFGSTSLTSTSGLDIFVAKLNTNGQWQWAASAGGTNSDVAQSITIDSYGNSYITGYFSGNLGFGGGPYITSAGLDDIFVAKLNSNGQWQWAANAGGTSIDKGLGIVTDTKGSIYITGGYIGTIKFSNPNLSYLTSVGNEDIFVAKLNNDGLWQWAVSAGGSGNENAVSIGADTLSNVYITGIFSYKVNFGSKSISPQGGGDIYVAKLNNNAQWQWVVNAGGLESEQSNSIATDTAGTTYITGRFNGTANFGSESINGAADIFIAKLKEENLAINTGPNQSIICGNKAQLSANGSGFSKISWYPQSGLDNPNAITTFASPNKTTTYTIKAENSCGDSVTSKVTVTVNPLQVSATTDKNSINCGETIKLTANPNISDQVSYSWTPAIGLNNPNIANPTARPATNTTYTVTATTPNGCSATSQVTITVNNPNPPAVGLTTSIGEKYFCNSGLTLSASAGFASYKWNTGATTQSIIPTQPGTYTVEIIDNNGCGNKDSITLTPLTKIIAPDGPYLCAGQPNASVRLDAGAGFDSYEWSNGQQTQSLTVTTTGTYSVKVTKGSCQYTTSIQVMNHPGSTNAEFTYQSNGLKTQFTTLTQGVRFVDWNFGDGKNSSDLNPEHTFAQAGTYTVCLELTDFCGATDKQCKSITVNAPNGIEKIREVKENVKIYPNPATDQLVIEFEKITNTPIIITDITGRQVLNTIRPISNVMTFDISTLSNGLYFIAINQILHKFVKQ